MMKCSKCGAELSDDTKFCSYCGNKIEAVTPPPIKETEEDSIPDDAQQKPANETARKSDSPKSLADKIKSKSSEKWHKLSMYGKITAVAMIAFALLCLIAFLFGKTAAGIIAIFQIVLTVVAVLMKKQIIKTPKSWLHIVALVLAVVLLVPYVSLFGTDYGDAEKFKWSNILLSDVIPEPKSHLGEILVNSEEHLSLYVYKTNAGDYSKYVDACEEKGFTVEAEQSDLSYYAYNADGYKLSLYYDGNDSKMNISVDAAEEYGTLVWPDSVIASMLPAPKSTTGEIAQDDEKGFAAYVSNTPIEEFNAYVEACADKGFTENASESEKLYSAQNSDGYQLSVSYQGNGVMSISVDEPEYAVSLEIECVENLLFSKYDVDVYVNDSMQGTISHGTTETYNLNLTKGVYEIKFVSTEDDAVTGGVSMDIHQSESLKYKISCTSSQINVETIKGTVSEHGEDTASTASSDPDTSPATQLTDITLTMGEEDFKGMNYQEAEKIFRDMGFTSFEYRTVDTETESAQDTICYIEITEWLIGDSDFIAGDKFGADSTVTFFSYEYVESTAPSSVFYSTNDYETAKEGNTGAFSYRERGGSYDIYWIIDFDEGYVYYFTDGDGESFCDRLKIDSGTLNDKITITYHDGEDTWSYNLHFKYVNHPETLIMVDQNGFEYEYSTTDLNDALALRDTKDITDY